ncbi:MAG TPA: ribonuclease III [Syntrophales bacterium]|nr:ribonuclease III [Syntrophales bacterium]HQQ28226.1 ribonuclease III [Syntrophales bacterium]
MDRPQPPLDERRERLRDLERNLSIRFGNAVLLDTALTHRSFVNENQDPPREDNERLEFLGDAVLELCVSDLLVRMHPDFSEGRLSKLRASLVNEQPLATMAESFDVGSYLLLGRGEEASGGRTKPSILANAFEAILAAVYLDRGYDEAYRFIERVFGPLLRKDSPDPLYRDYKTNLQEACQSRFRVIPRYMLLHEYGPDHDKIFHVRLTVADILTATGTGRNKKEAEQDAARKALERIEGMVGTPP